MSTNIYYIMYTYLCNVGTCHNNTKYSAAFKNLKNAERSAEMMISAVGKDGSHFYDYIILVYICVYILLYMKVF